MPRKKIKQDFNFTTLKGFKIINLTTCDRFYNKKKTRIAKLSIQLFLMANFDRVNGPIYMRVLERTPI